MATMVLFLMVSAAVRTMRPKFCMMSSTPAAAAAPESTTARYAAAPREPPGFDQEGHDTAPHEAGELLRGADGTARDAHAHAHAPDRHTPRPVPHSDGAHGRA
eukprot:CAMPEP_0206256782 /NCGR_PEP_ID=MMETSP0047_2-20121206/24973_1 /ASSEMBLY_ACC=CAM_ASM_000192 /TAXON_ID=195065 /ORGANISM="Chroomonas mesostigmatica_cf, Strain CCMP1168" /LENGTH=102 /DNA_ID=CAMNT_0053683289 /DNA_START=87 /DNA_END=391 /DNA_ORIENTATION=+